MIPIARPQMGEEEKERVWEAMSSGSLAQGPRVKQLEDSLASKQAFLDMARKAAEDFSG